MSSYPLSNSAASISNILDEEVLDGAVDAMPGSEMKPTPPTPSQSSPSIGSTPSSSVPLPPSSSSLSSTSTSANKSGPHFIKIVQVKGNKVSVQLPQNRSCKVKRYNVALDLPSSKGSDKSVDASITRVDLVDDSTTSEH